MVTLASRLTPTAAARMEHAITGMLLTGTVVAVLGLTTLFFPVRVFSRMDIRVTQPVVEGADLRVVIDYCKRWDWAPVETRWTLRDGINQSLPEQLVTLDRGCHVVTTYVRTTPHMTAGDYTLTFLGLYRPFPWRIVAEAQTSHIFTVTRGKDMQP
jgi:hypothetical protein